MNLSHHPGRRVRGADTSTRRRWLAAAGALLVAAASGCSGSSGSDGGNWLLVLGNQGSISLVNTDTGYAHGPFLKGQLGGGGGLFDAVVTPDGKTALISGFGDRRVYFVDLTDLAAPALLGHVNVEMFAEDVSLTKDGRYAIVTDGGFNPYVVVLDVASRAIVQTKQHRDVYTCGNAVAPDGTVVTVNYFGASVEADPYGKRTVLGGSIVTWTIGADGRLTHANDYNVFLRTSGELSADSRAHAARPVNVAIAPDGQTVLVPDVSNYNDSNGLDGTADWSSGMAQYAMAVYRITSPGVLAYQGLVTGLPRAVQSIAFNEAGTEAYLLGNNGRTYQADGTFIESTPDQVMVLRITAPGVVQLDAARTADLLRNSGSQLFGVDNIVARKGKAYASYSTLSGPSVAGEPVRLRALSVVDVQTGEMTRLATGHGPDDLVSGVALVPRSQAIARPSAGAATCVGFCEGANRAAGCFCDARCVDFGDCCPDQAAACTACDPATCTGGMTCVNLPGGAFGCGCPEGWVDDGAGTCVDVDECAAGTDRCKPEATCTNFGGGFNCECPAAFQPDGAGGCECPYGYRDDGAGGCAIVDRCAEGTHACQAGSTCTPLSGGPGYDCACAAPLLQDGAGGCKCDVGFEPDGAGGCMDVDECARGTAACHGDATCRNADGRYYCDCAAPLVEDGTGGCMTAP